MNSNKTQDQLLLGTLKNNDESGIIAYASQILYVGDLAVDVSIQDIINDLAADLTDVTTTANNAKSIASTANTTATTAKNKADALDTNLSELQEVVQAGESNTQIGASNRSTTLLGTSLKYGTKTIATTDLIPDVSTYLTKTDASNTYLQQSVATSTYVTKTTTGELSNLTTSNKTNLVSAINEVKTLTESSGAKLNYYNENTSSKSFNFSIDSTEIISGNKEQVYFYTEVFGIEGKTFTFNNKNVVTSDYLNDYALKTDVPDISTYLSSEDIASMYLSIKDAKSTYLSITDANNIFYSKINTDSLLANKVDVVSGKQLSTNDYTTAEKNKLASLSNYTLPTASSATLGGIKLGFSDSGENNDYPVKVDDSGNAYVNVPWYVVTYPLASATTEGLMSKADKVKLDGMTPIVILTQSEYDTLTTKDENTIYYIKE